MSDWLSAHLQQCALSDQHQKYLHKRGLTVESTVSFYTWSPSNTDAPCPRFVSNFGVKGERLNDCIVYPILCPRENIIGFEARRHLPDGTKKVTQYRTDSAKWNPYIIGAPKAFKTLWDGSDVWIVEGVFDLLALEKVTPSCDCVLSSLRAGMDDISIDTLSRFATKASTFYIAYDNDETGKTKAQWLRRQFINRGARCEVWKYTGKDPNEVWQIGGERLLRRLFL